MTICQRLIPNKKVFYYIGAQIEANNINANEILSAVSTELKFKFSNHGEFDPGSG